MKVLIACESSGRVRDAFLSRGHDAISCDLKPSERLGPHLQCDVREVIRQDWDLMIAHPVCKRLANSGVQWLGKRAAYWPAMEKAVEFFLLFEKAHHIPRRCVENPVMHGYALERVGRSASQFVQPWMFGDPFSKATGLWLTGLPLLRPMYRRTDFREIKQACWLEAPGPEREANRARTYPSIAQAMADQWSK